MHEPRGWHSRGYLPHCDEPGRIQAITFRLADSLPRELRERWRSATPEEIATWRARWQSALDAGHGSCWLRDGGVAETVEQELLWFDSQRYCLLAWVVMPNHVHALIETRTEYSLSSIVQSWKWRSARQANKLLGRKGAFWQPDYYDRYIRDDDHLGRAVEYIHANPVRAGLVERPADWLFGSARWTDALNATFHAPWQR